jgi:hypothetical protein
MVRWIVRCLVGVLVAASALSTASTVTAAAPEAVASTYTFNSHRHIAAGAPSTTERGPPAAFDLDAIYAAANHWSGGVSARADFGSTSIDTVNDHVATLVQGAHATGSTSGRAEVIRDDLSPFLHSRVAAKGADEAGALVRYDPEFASRNLLGQVGKGYARTPSGYTVSAHAAERIVYGAPGRSPTTLSRVDDILNNPTRSVMRPDGSIRVFQGKDWVAVRGSGPIHIITVMVR